MKSAFDIKEICEEYCDEAVIHSKTKWLSWIGENTSKTEYKVNAHNWLLKK